MDLPRVGVLSDDPTLVVALGLRCPSLVFLPVARAEDLADHDLALVDLPRAGMATSEVFDLLGATPTVAVAGERVELPRGVTTVRRPCSVEQLAAAVRAAQAGTPDDEAVVVDDLVVLDDDVLVLDEVEVMEKQTAAAGPPLFAGRSPTLAGRLARQLREIHALAEPLGASTVVTAAIAEQLAEVLAEQCGADQVCLWGRHDRAHVLLAATGDRAAVDGVRLSCDEPLLLEARRSPAGISRRGPGEGGLPDLSRPVHATLGLVSVQASGPVAVVTVVGPTVTDAHLCRIRDVLAGPAASVGTHG